MMSLEGKVAIVTGASRGIGASIVEKFSALGAQVFFTYKSSKQLAEDLENKTKAKAICCAQENFAEIQNTVDAIYAETKKIDIFVNNAGITKDSYLLMMTESDWQDVLNVNANAAFVWTKSIAKKMYTQKSGSIIHIASVSGILGLAGQANYGASKAAICALTRTAAAELGRKNIRVNAICPGFIETDMLSKMPKDVLREQTGRIALKRLGQADEVANLAAFLAGDESAYITGQSIVIDGGLSSCV